MRRKVRNRYDFIQKYFAGITRCYTLVPKLFQNGFDAGKLVKTTHLDMGDRFQPPSVWPRDNPPPPPRSARPRLALVGLAALALYLGYAKFSDFVEEREGGYALRPERAAELERQGRKLEESEEVYALVATSNGYYTCLHCPERIFYLFKVKSLNTEPREMARQGGILPPTMFKGRSITGCCSGATSWRP
jgi:hypothetical protein